ncbi:hypothetical protein LVJ83_02200 [Uruburuella testudinis]|uniref:Uncharacterized protein n=1 Tax=Uruburuella testudinis TaxID=1282863 RepID=A0ABY4DTE2_9NEIS|nr:hypothetical protein [Uruburuella testudinis]UOO82309.1 hypothetical protein LVJ83_02200 [Uruburuella testudinis]
MQQTKATAGKWVVAFLIGYEIFRRPALSSNISKMIQIEAEFAAQLSMHAEAAYPFKKQPGCVAEACRLAHFFLHSTITYFYEKAV